MSGECEKCRVTFAGGEVVARCVECKKAYHPVCTRFASSQNFTKAKNKNWKCDKCAEDTASLTSAKSTDSISDDKSSRSIFDAITAMKREIISTLDTKIGNVQVSIVAVNEELQSISNRFTVIENEQSCLKSRCDQLEQASGVLNEGMSDMQRKLQDLEQHSRSANIEVTGFPLTPGENVMVCLENIARVINVPFKKEDISIAHRLRVHAKKQPHPPIVVQFVSRVVKQTWLTAGRTKKRICSSEVLASLPVSTIYINDHLTGFHKMLLGRARRLMREKKLHFAAYVNGKVLIKPRKGTIL